jgi:hypothetical protein
MNVGDFSDKFVGGSASLPPHPPSPRDAACGDLSPQVWERCEVTGLLMMLNGSASATPLSHTWGRGREMLSQRKHLAGEGGRGGSAIGVAVVIRRRASSPEAA